MRLACRQREESEREVQLYRPPALPLGVLCESRGHARSPLAIACSRSRIGRQGPRPIIIRTYVRIPDPGTFLGLVTRLSQGRNKHRSRFHQPLWPQRFGPPPLGRCRPNRESPQEEKPGLVRASGVVQGCRLPALIRPELTGLIAPETSRSQRRAGSAAVPSVDRARSTAWSCARVSPERPKPGPGPGFRDAPPPHWRPAVGRRRPEERWKVAAARNLRRRKGRGVTPVGQTCYVPEKLKAELPPPTLSFIGGSRKPGEGAPRPIAVPTRTPEARTSPGFLTQSPVRGLRTPRAAAAWGSLLLATTIARK